MKFGFTGLNQKNNNNNNLNENLNNINLKVARVTDIILDESHSDFKLYGEWNALGVIKFEFLDNRLNSSKNTAKPINSNNKNFPLINEFVYILELPNLEIDNNPYSVSNYYISSINIWNHPHHNAYPNYSFKSKDYDLTQLGKQNTPPSELNVKLGNTFNEKSDIHPLLPFEGDVIYEGRWGNSIRFGSTINKKNNWSVIGKNGDPILIIRNGQGIRSNEGWLPITEDINKDDSSIYLTSTQNIPIEASSTDYTSYSDIQPTSPKNYSGKQIILNSGRLVFNSNKDHILFSSLKSINLNSKESVNVDTKEFVIQSNNIFLGKKELAKEPLMLGNSTVDFLKNFIECFEQLLEELKTAQTTPTIQGSPSSIPKMSLAAINGLIKIDSLKKSLDKLTSKRNFTL